MRPYCRKRGQKSVIRKASPLGNETVVTNILVFGRYCCVVVASEEETDEEMENWPPSWSRIFPKIGGLSGLGRHNQSRDPCALISAEIWQFPMSPYWYTG